MLATVTPVLAALTCAATLTIGVAAAAETGTPRQSLPDTVPELRTLLVEQQTRARAQDQRIAALQEALQQARERQGELQGIAEQARSQAFTQATRIAELTEELASKEAESRRQQALLALIRTQYPQVWGQVTSADTGPLERINATVAAIKHSPQGEPTLVMLSVGADAKVRQGMEFTIYRDNTYIVKVRVERVLRDMAACRILEDTWNEKGLEIQAGDLASNRLF